MLKSKLIQFRPRRQAFSGLIGVGFLRLADICSWQARTFRVTQRVLRKRQENIFPNVRRQVHQIVRNLDRFLPVERQVQRPVGHLQLVLERLEAAHTLAIQGQAQASLYQQPFLQFLNLQVVFQWMLNPDHLVPRV